MIDCKRKNTGLAFFFVVAINQIFPHIKAAKEEIIYIGSK
jgi:hypothetical protein